MDSLARANQNKLILEGLSEQTDKTLPLHVFIFHDLWNNPLTMVTRIDFSQYLTQSNMMIVAYDTIVKVICAPLQVTPENVKLLIDSIYIPSGYQLTLDGDNIANEICSRTFTNGQCSLKDYIGQIYIHQLN
jgi:hypothetical protein